MLKGTAPLKISSSLLFQTNFHSFWGSKNAQLLLSTWFRCALAMSFSFLYIPAKYDFPKSSGLCCVTIGKRSPHVNNGPGLDGAGDAE